MTIILLRTESSTPTKLVNLLILVTSKIKDFEGHYFKLVILSSNSIRLFYILCQTAKAYPTTHINHNTTGWNFNVVTHIYQLIIIINKSVFVGFISSSISNHHNTNSVSISNCRLYCALWSDHISCEAGKICYNEVIASFNFMWGFPYF